MFLMLTLYHTEKVTEIKSNKSLNIEFIKEMSRFLPEKEVKTLQTQNNIWDYIIFLMDEFNKSIKK